ncbi:MAG: hypothetical protein Q7R33_00845 [Nitrosarchaeum sp.]|nr:hypothetical protein [Nitrosarchaeum sp.]
MRYFLIVNKQATITDILEVSGIRPSNFWFEYFLSIFKDKCQKFESFMDLVKFLHIRIEADYIADYLTCFASTIKQLNMFEINDQLFQEKCVFVLDFDGVDFCKLKSRKLKVIVANDKE